MSKQSEFFLYLMEHYAEYKGLTAAQILEEWDSVGVTELIYDMYEMYHIERLENAFEDIDKLIDEYGNK